MSTPVPKSSARATWSTPKKSATIRLVCFPYAGAMATVYRDWSHALPPWVDVYPVEYPGRGSRMREPLRDRMPALLDGLLDGLGAVLDLPLAFFGHSLGGLVAFETARALRRAGRPVPAHLFVSATPAPHLVPRAPGSGPLDDEEVVRRLRRLAGTTGHAFESDAVMRLVLPVARADFSVVDTYGHRCEVPLELPITALGGRHDDLVPETALREWDAHTSRAFEIELLPGGHFFLHAQRDRVLAHVLRVLAPHRKR